MSSLRTFLRDVVTACQPRELVEAHREIERVHKLYAAAILREAHARAAINQARKAADDIEAEAHHLFGDGDRPSNQLGRANGMLHAANRIRAALTGH